MNTTVHLNIKDEKERKMINKVIKNLVEMIEEKNGRVSVPATQHNAYEDLLFNFLFEKSNLEKILSKLKVSHKTIIHFDEFKHLKDTEEKDLIDKFQLCLNKRLKVKKNSKMNVYSFIFFLNISKFKEFSESDTKNIEKFKNILEVFDIYRADYQEFNDDLKELRNLILRSGGETVIIKVKARDYYYAFTEAKFKLEIFLGFLEFDENLFRKGWSYPSFDRGNYAINKINSRLLIILENQEIIDPYIYNEIEYKDTFEYYVSLYKYLPDNVLSDGKFDLKHLEIIQNNCELIKNIKNEKLLKTIYNAFSLYYLAISEKTLENSYIKFWMISELIIKSTGGKNDNALKEVMVKFLKSVIRLPIYEFLTERIEYLYNRRNDLVHEGKIRKISLEDRDLSKTIAESILVSFLDSQPSNFAEFHEYINQIS